MGSCYLDMSARLDTELKQTPNLLESLDVAPTRADSLSIVTMLEIVAEIRLIFRYPYRKY